MSPLVRHLEPVASSAPVLKAVSGLGQRILQIHPSLTCNLRCRHCYSSSGPAQKGALDSKMLCSAISDAAAMGYEVVAISGGEPLVYQELPRVLAHAKQVGMRTTVTTNGTLLDQRHLEPLRDCLDLLAISLDGPPQIHNALRQSEDAFARLTVGLEHVRTYGFPFGFIHTLTRVSWEHLLWTAEFAADAGARLLQLHPLESAGRAGPSMQGDVPDDDVLSRVYVLALVLGAKYRNAMQIQLDVFNRNQLLRTPELIYATDWDETLAATVPADLLGLLVVEAGGVVVPLSYGFAHDYRICNLYEQRLATAWPAYVWSGYPRFRRLCREVLKEIAIPSDLPFLNWHELIVAHSHKAGLVTATLGQRSGTSV